LETLQKNPPIWFRKKPPKYLKTNSVVILNLEAVARVLGALEGADRDIHDEADVALLALVAVAVPVCHPATLPPRLLQVL
jgi:hypothetical protein